MQSALVRGRHPRPGGLYFLMGPLSFLWHRKHGCPEAPRDGGLQPGLGTGVL